MVSLLSVCVWFPFPKLATRSRLHNFERRNLSLNERLRHLFSAHKKVETWSPPAVTVRPRLWWRSFPNVALSMRFDLSPARRGKKTRLCGTSDFEELLPYGLRDNRKLGVFFALAPFVWRHLLCQTEATQCKFGTWYIDLPATLRTRGVRWHLFCKPVTRHFNLSWLAKMSLRVELLLSPLSTGALDSSWKPVHTTWVRVVRLFLDKASRHTCKGQLTHHRVKVIPLNPFHV